MPILLCQPSALPVYPAWPAAAPEDPSQAIRHTFPLCSAFHADLDRFLAYALSQPSQDVWFVTHAQLLDWMEAPVPASQMKSFMAQYDCSS